NEAPSGSFSTQRAHARVAPRDRVRHYQANSRSFRSPWFIVGPPCACPRIGRPNWSFGSFSGIWAAITAICHGCLLSRNKGLLRPLESIGVQWRSVMAQRANWKGFLRLSLVTCPVALFPATSESEKISFNQINKNTGNRIKYRKVDAETGDEVEADDI